MLRQAAELLSWLNHSVVTWEHYVTRLKDFGASGLAGLAGLQAGRGWCSSTAPYW